MSDMNPVAWVKGEYYAECVFKRTISDARGYWVTFDDVVYGMVLPNARGHWTTISTRVPNPYGVVEGFATRFDATTFIMKVSGLQRNHDNHLDTNHKEYIIEELRKVLDIEDVGDTIAPILEKYKETV